MGGNKPAVKKIKEKWFSKFVVEKIPELTGRTIAVTGTTSGLGFFVVIAAVRKGAKTVYVLNRSSKRVQDSLQKLEEEKERVGSSTEIITIDCDLASFESVRNAADLLKERCAEDGIDVLINNAGIAGTPMPLTKDGFHSQFQINFFSHFLLVDLIKSELEKAAEKKGTASRIVNVSSGARPQGKFDAKHYQKWDAKREKVDLYAHTKVATGLFTLEFNLRNDKKKVFATLADPGICTTDAFESKEGGDKKRDFNEKFLIFVTNHFGVAQAPEDGAMNLLMAAFGEQVSPGDFFVPSKMSGLYGPPKKAIDNGKPTWTFYREKNILDTRSSAELWDLTSKLVNKL